ncbi:anti-sigma factor domain-containing protein [Halobacillus kuroshimensis]|uniref:Anti-sigma factor domain-containing protein n=1 Tax=Halobacillus kuroshimensis TaxID=302481 RepID=A0ABS3E0W8_9BACI|nr:anti-sigma factor domain-containing protein [Halobacillus kuroshimensis]
MKTGIVMERKKEYMIVMTNEGRFYRAVTIAHAEVGTEVQFQSIPPSKAARQWSQMLQYRYTKAVVAAVLFLMVLIPAYSWHGSNQAFAYMNIDINPSVELKLNDRMQVLDIEPNNAEAEEIVALLSDWKKEDASDVTMDLIQASRDNGFVNEGNQVLIGISYLESDFDHQYLEEMEGTLNEESKQMTVAAYLIPDEWRRKAKDDDLSVNKWMAERLTDEENLNEDTENIPETIDDTDKEIIQSFYQKPASQGEKDTSESSDDFSDAVPVHPKVEPQNSIERQSPGGDQEKEPELLPGKAEFDLHHEDRSSRSPATSNNGNDPVPETLP